VWSEAWALNDNGLAVGHSSDTAVVWQVNAKGNVAVSALPGLNGENWSSAYNVNNLGMIVGESVGSSSHAVVWTGSFGSYVPHQLAGDWSHAAEISEPDQNQHVWVVGDSAPDSAVLWQVDAQGNVLSTTSLSLGSAFDAQVCDVQVIGHSVFAVGEFDSRPVVWEVGLDGVLVGRIDLGTLGGDYGRAYAINGNGAVAGDSRVPDSYFRYPFLYEDGVMTPLGSLGNGNAFAWGMNDANIVVGEYENRTPPDSNNIERFAFVWEAGTMYDLARQVSDSQFQRLFGAWDVNAEGEIVGEGSFRLPRQNQEHGFLARPAGIDGTTTVHVGDLDGISTSGSRGKWNATVSITVHSGEETPLEGATVSGTWSGGATGSSSCVTNAAGQCSVTKSKLSGGSVTFTVDTLTLSGATYEPAANHDPDGDSSGTVITVSSGTSSAAIAAAIASQGTLQNVDAVFETVADDSGTAEKDDPLLPSHRMNTAAVARLAVSVAPPAAEDRFAALGSGAVLDEDEAMEEASLLDGEFDDFITDGWM
jgi:probable HAF family extracellular repeat protein